MTRRATADAPNPEATSGHSSELVVVNGLHPPTDASDGRELD
jgi:hypothetical protein